MGAWSFLSTMLTENWSPIAPVRGSDATAVPRPIGFCQIGDPFQHASRRLQRGQLRHRGGGFLRLHESAPSRHPGGRRADGIGSLRVPASSASGEIPPGRPPLGWRPNRPQGEHRHRSKATAELRSSSGPAARGRPTGPVVGEGDRKTPADGRQRRLAVR